MIMYNINTIHTYSPKHQTREPSLQHILESGTEARPACNTHVGTPQTCTYANNVELTKYMQNSHHDGNKLATKLHKNTEDIFRKFITKFIASQQS